MRIALVVNRVSQDADSLCARLQKTRVEYLLCPMARNFDDNSYSQERDTYAGRAAVAGATMLLVNQLGGDPESGDAFGGAMIVTSKGVILHELPLGREGLLIATL